jgi:hypothetical protein
VALFEIVAIEGPLLVTVTVTADGGAVARLTLTLVCMFAPIVALPMLLFGADTAAVID